MHMCVHEYVHVHVHVYVCALYNRSIKSSRASSNIIVVFARPHP